MNWIKQNRHKYHLDHSISLIVAKIPPKNKQELALKEKGGIRYLSLKEQVEFLYEEAI